MCANSEATWLLLLLTWCIVTGMARLNVPPSSPPISLTPPEQVARHVPWPGQTAMQPWGHELLAEQVPSLAVHEQFSKGAAAGTLRRSRQVRRQAAKSF